MFYTINSVPRTLICEWEILHYLLPEEHVYYFILLDIFLETKMFSKLLHFSEWEGWSMARFLFLIFYYGGLNY